MGLNVGSLHNVNIARPSIDSQALARVTEQILNPNNNNQTIDVSKLDLSKFNRVNLGTDLYSSRTNGEVALKAAQASTDFGVKLSQNFVSGIEYLNSQAAQSLFTSKENTGKVVVNVENAQKVTENQVVLASTQITETKDLNKDKRGSNPFSFYMPAEQAEEREELGEIDSIFTNSLNIFA